MCDSCCRKDAKIDALVHEIRNLRNKLENLKSESEASEAKPCSSLQPTNDEHDDDDVDEDAVLLLLKPVPTAGVLDTLLAEEQDAWSRAEVDEHNPRPADPQLYRRRIVDALIASPPGSTFVATYDDNGYSSLLFSKLFSLPVYDNPVEALPGIWGLPVYVTVGIPSEWTTGCICPLKTHHIQKVQENIKRPGVFRGNEKAVQEACLAGLRADWEAFVAPLSRYERQLGVCMFVWFRPDARLLVRILLRVDNTTKM